MMGLEKTDLVKSAAFSSEPKVNPNRESNLWLKVLEDPSSSQFRKTYAEVKDIVDYSTTHWKTVLPAAGILFVSALLKDEALKVAQDPDKKFASRKALFQGSLKIAFGKILEFFGKILFLRRLRVKGNILLNVGRMQYSQGAAKQKVREGAAVLSRAMERILKEIPFKF